MRLVLLRKPFVHDDSVTSRARLLRRERGRKRAGTDGWADGQIASAQGVEPASLYAPFLSLLSRACGGRQGVFLTSVLGEDTRENAGGDCPGSPRCTCVCRCSLVSRFSYSTVPLDVLERSVHGASGEKQPPRRPSPRKNESTQKLHIYLLQNAIVFLRSSCLRMES